MVFMQRSQFIISFVVNNELDIDIATITEFYRDVAVCVKIGVCDEETIKIYFDNIGGSFFKVFYPYTCDLGGKWKDSRNWVVTYQRYLPKHLLASDICGD